jgi:hypothetical protein
LKPARQSCCNSGMYQSTLKAHEGCKRTGIFSKSYGLAINVTIDDQHPIEEEIRHVNECFVNWLRNHGKQCGDLVLAFVAPAAIHDQIRDLVGKLLDQPLEMDAVISRLNICLGLFNSATGAMTEHKIKWNPPKV